MTSGSPAGGRGEQRRLSITTLMIAAAASATAAIVTSQFWVGGTPIAAALTPVIVALVSELLHRPTQMIAGRLTSDSRALQPGRPGAKPPRERARESGPGATGPEAAEAGPMNVYRPRQTQRRKIAVGVVASTAVLAFAIAAAALTLPELITGQSLGKGNGRTSLFSPNKKKKDENQTQPTVTETAPSRTT